MIAGVLAKVQQLINRLGQSTDAASSTGSLHAKVSELRNNIVRTAGHGYFSTMANTWTTALSLTGPGRLIYLKATNTGGNQYLRVTIDGGSPIVILSSAASGNLFVTINGDSSSTPIEIDLSFKNSLLIECYTGSAAAQGVLWHYEQ